MIALIIVVLAGMALGCAGAPLACGSCDDAGIGVVTLYCGS